MIGWSSIFCNGEKVGREKDLLKVDVTFAATVCWRTGCELKRKQCPSRCFCSTLRRTWGSFGLRPVVDLCRTFEEVHTVVCNSCLYFEREEDEETQTQENRATKSLLFSFQWSLIQKDKEMQRTMATILFFYVAEFNADKDHHSHIDRFLWCHFRRLDKHENSCQFLSQWNAVKACG